MSPTPQAPGGDDRAGRAGQRGQYVVVARRYRPQRFEDLIGQEPVARALSNAVEARRVGHAYLFTGARGVGKTSAARILAKALNCPQGPSPTPCNQCDICLSIATGEDVDVLEIDGASNRGIDEIRQLRQNVNVRPSRGRFKIYIIDEVHMLTREAFNALLKTLEEPPEHVKFIFCTTEPTKIPVTILSRCQRFDFAGVPAKAIAARLAEIVAAEGAEADPEALEGLARRAAGSMRDAQSLLDQLLAFAPGRITLAEVHAMLGTADQEQILRLAERITERDASGALAELDAALARGVDEGLLIEQLLGFFRDCMAAAAGCSEETFQFADPQSSGPAAEMARRLGLETILAAMQILDHTLGRLRFSTQGRVLAELALVRLCALEDLARLPDLIAQLEAGAAEGGGAGDSERGPSREGPARSRPATGAGAGPATAGSAEAPGESLTEPRAAELWSKALERVSGIAAEHARHFDQLAVPEPNRLVVQFKPGYNLAKSFCERPEQVAKFEAALAEVTGQPVRVEFTLAEASGPDRPSGPKRATPPQQQVVEVSKHPLIQRASELFGAHPLRVDRPPEQP